MVPNCATHRILRKVWKINICVSYVFYVLKSRFQKRSFYKTNKKNSSNRTSRQGGGTATKEKVPLCNDKLSHSILQVATRISYRTFFSTSGKNTDKAFPGQVLLILSLRLYCATRGFLFLEFEELFDWTKRFCSARNDWIKNVQTHEI